MAKRAASNKYAQIEGSKYRLWTPDELPKAYANGDIVGYVPNPLAVERGLRDEKHPIFSLAAADLIKDYERKTTLLYEHLLYVNPDYKRGAQGIGSCYAKGTLVQGVNDSKRIEDITLGEIVFTGNGKPTKVISKEISVSYQPLLTLKAYGSLPLTVTADHKVMVYRLGTVEEKGKTRYINKALCGRYGNNPNSAAVQTYEARKPELVEAKDLKIGDCLLTPKKVHTGEKAPDISEDAKFVLGYFLGNGHASGGTVEYVVPHKKQEIIEEIKAYYERFGLRVTEKVEQFHSVVRVNSVEMVKWHRRVCYSTSGAKTMPAWAIGDTDVLEGLIASDGFYSVHKGTKTVNFDNTSLSLVFGVRSTLLAKGYEPTITPLSRSEGTKANAKPLYRVTATLDKQGRSKVWSDDDYLCMPIRSIEAEEGPHTVYDIGVQDAEHTFLANGVAASNCVGWGLEIAQTILTAKLFHKAKKKSDFYEVSTEACYGGSRCEAQGKTFAGYSDGSWGYAAAKFAKNFGTVYRKDYSGVTGSADDNLTRYDVKKEKEWGAYGCGGKDDKGLLDAIAKEYPVKTVSKVNNFEDVAACVAGARCPVTIASMYACSMRRDANGFCRRQGSWAHQMCIIGVRFDPDGALIAQSWGPNSASGPKWPTDMPNNIAGFTWWAPASDVDWICRDDCWAIGDVEGWELDTTDYSLW